MDRLKKVKLIDGPAFERLYMEMETIAEEEPEGPLILNKQPRKKPKTPSKAPLDYTSHDEDPSIFDAGGDKGAPEAPKTPTPKPPTPKLPVPKESLVVNPNMGSIESMDAFEQAMSIGIDLHTATYQEVIQFLARSALFGNLCGAENCGVRTFQQGDRIGLAKVLTPIVKKADPPSAPCPAPAPEASKAPSVQYTSNSTSSKTVYKKDDLGSLYRAEVADNGLKFELLTLAGQKGIEVIIPWTFLKKNVKTSTDRASLLKAYYRSQGIINRVLTKYQLK